MDGFTIMFPSRPGGWEVVEGFAEEYSVASSMPFFDAVLFDVEKAVDEETLHFSRRPRNFGAPVMYRGPRLSLLQYKSLYKTAEKLGIRMIADDWRYRSTHEFTFDDCHVLGESHRDTPETRSMNRHSGYRECGGGYRRALVDSRGGERAVANSNGCKKVMKNLDADNRVVTTFEDMPEEEFGRLLDKHLDEDADAIYGNLIVQKCVELKRYGAATNEWRGWFFDGQLFEMLPNSGQPSNAPKPPQWLIEKHCSESAFYELDFAELYDGDWLIIGADDGQVAKRALNQNVEDFYSSLERIARESPHLPEWIWCLVANVSEDATHVKKDGTEGRGTKHFSPGTKVCIGSKRHICDGYWTVVVMGKPCRQKKLIQIYMRSDRLCNFRIKKVYDKRVIENMTRFGRDCLRLGLSPDVHGGWDNTDESKKEIMEWVGCLNDLHFWDRCR